MNFLLQRQSVHWYLLQIKLFHLDDKQMTWWFCTEHVHKKWQSWIYFIHAEIYTWKKAHTKLIHNKYTTNQSEVNPTVKIHYYLCHYCIIIIIIVCIIILFSQEHLRRWTVWGALEFDSFTGGWKHTKI